MAVTTTNSIQFVFKDASDRDNSFTLANADPEAEDSDVKAFMDVCVQNGDIWEDQLVEKVSAKLITRTVTDYDLS